jgi:hypothetical protein
MKLQSLEMTSSEITQMLFLLTFGDVDSG